MNRKTAASRLTRWKAALVLTVASTSLLGAASASATTYRPVDGPALQTAITAANSNAGLDTIILRDDLYQPLTPITITDALVITGDHANQALNGGPTIDGSQVVPYAADFITVAALTNVNFVGFSLIGATEGIPYAVVRSNGGNIRLDNMLLGGNNGAQFVQSGGATAVLNNTGITDGAVGGITSNASSLTLNNSTVSGNGNGGIVASGTFRLNNSIVANNDPFGFGQKDCFNRATTQVRSLDSDGSCGVSLPRVNPLLVSTVNDGGPTATPKILAGSPAIDAGDNSICPTVDQRFFVRSDGACDIGSFEFGAQQDVTPPTCVVTALRAGPPKQQDVTVTDSGSGIGPDAITDQAITNGSIAFTPFSNPSRSGLVLTATKNDQLTTTRWSFTATDWAGNVKDCR